MAASLAPVSFTSPGYDYSAELSEIARRQKMAEALTAQSQEPIDPRQSAGGWNIPISPWQGAAQMGKALAGNLAAGRSQQQQRELSAKAQRDLADVLRRGSQAMTGTPVAMGYGGAGDVSQQAATGPDMNAAAEAYMSHPMTAPLGMAMAQQGIQQKQRQQMMADIMRGMPQGGTAPGESSTPTSALPPQAVALMASGDPALMKIGETLVKQQITPYQQAQLSQGERHYQGVPGAKQAELTQAERHYQGISPYQQAELANKGKQLGIAGGHLEEQKRHNLMVEGDPATIEATAQGIATGHLQPLSGFALARPMGQQIMARVTQLNPNYNPTQFQVQMKAEKDFSTGKQGQQVKSFNVALAHLDTLDQLSEALHNGNVVAINKVGNMVATQTGQPAPTNFVAAKKIVGDEIVKAIVGGGGGVADREEAAKTISAANSPAQLKGVINTYKELMRGQLGGLRQQYETSTGRKDFDRFLSESGQAAAHGPANPGRRSSDFKVLGTE